MAPDGAELTTIGTHSQELSSLMVIGILPLSEANLDCQVPDDPMADDRPMRQPNRNRETTLSQHFPADL